MEKRVISCLCTIGFAGLLFAFGDLLIPQENVIFEADTRPKEFSELVTSQEYAVWALRGFVGVIMEMIGTVGVYLYLQKTRAERLAFYGLLLTLTHHILGVGVFAIAYFLFPAAGELFLMGQTEAIRYVTMSGALQNFMAISLLSTLLGLALMAVAIWKSGVLPKWSGWLVFLGFALIPFPGVALQFLANILWGTTYFYMALIVYKQHRQHVAVQDPAARHLVA